MEFTALLQILQQAIRKVPVVRYALGVAGVAAAAAIVVAIFQQKVEIAIFGTAIMFCFMVILFVFATLTRTASSAPTQYAASFCFGRQSPVFAPRSS
jgi:hypothetical protein